MVTGGYDTPSVSDFQDAGCVEALKLARASSPDSDKRTEKGCDDCYFAYCAKHLTALPVNNITYQPVSVATKLIASVQLVRDGRNIDPDRKPPRI